MSATVDERRVRTRWRMADDETRVCRWDFALICRLANRLARDCVARGRTPVALGGARLTHDPRFGLDRAVAAVMAECLYVRPVFDDARAWWLQRLCDVSDGQDARRGERAA